MHDDANDTGWVTSSAPSNVPCVDVADASHAFSIGAFSAVAVADGTTAFPGWPLWSTNASAAEFAASERRHHLAPDTVRVDCVGLFVYTGRERVLIDPGAGAGMGMDFGRLAHRLRDAGVDPNAISTVIISHGHNDHFHGLLAEDGALRFPNARVVWSEAEWRYWSDDADRAVEDFRRLPLPEAVHQSQAASLRAVLPRLRRHLDLIAADGEVTSGIRLVRAPGHTPHHSAVLIGSGPSQLLYLGDVLHRTTSSFEHPEWAPVFDHQPDVAAATRRHLLGRAADDHLLVMGYHWRFPALGFARRDSGAFVFEAR